MIEGEIKVNDKLTLKISAEGQKELFKDLSTVQEIFGENSCGMCGSTDIKYVVRTVDGNDYFELRCAVLFCRLDSTKREEQYSLSVRTLKVNG